MKPSDPLSHAWSRLSCAHLQQVSLYDGTIAQCRACGLGATVRVPQFTYDTSYFTDDGKGGYNFDSGLSLALDEARFGRELDDLARAGVRSGSVLDIGCATGTFLAAAQSRGWTPSGVEVADFARVEASRRLNTEVVASLDDLPTGAQYDLVTLHHVLEHIHQPQEFLRTMVKPRVRGRLLIEVPNFDSLGSRIEAARWRDLRPEQHVYHYTRQSLSQLVTSAGFRVLRVRTLWIPLWSLRSASELLRLLGRAVISPDRRPRASMTPVKGARSATRPHYQPARGLRRLLTATSDLAFRPLVAAVEASGLGERLAIEAEPLEPVDAEPSERANRPNRPRRPESTR